MKVYDRFTAIGGEDATLIPKEYYLKDEYEDIKRALKDLKEKYNEGTIDEDDYDDFADSLRDFFEENTEINYENGYMVDIVSEKGTRKNNRILDIFVFNEKCADPEFASYNYNLGPRFPEDIELLQKKGLVYRDVITYSAKTLKVLGILKVLTKVNYYVSTKHSVICYYTYWY